MKVLGIIPARDGSKGVPEKNIRLLGRRPLLAYTAEAALNATTLDRVILTTDSEAIAEVGRGLGLDVPFLRPANLADDASPMFPVVRHALEFVEANDGPYDAVCLLQPTNPFRRSEDIDRCVEHLFRTGADSVVTVLRVPDSYNPQWTYWRSSDGSLVSVTGDDEPVSRRQDLSPAFHREGSVYVTRRNVIAEFGNLYGRKIFGYEVDPEYSVNIDTYDDWLEAERVLERLGANADEVAGSSG